MTNSELFLEQLKEQHGLMLNPQQRKAVLHTDGPALTLAVPGAGKTTMLICRTGNLIYNHDIMPQNILSITFTNAASRDMKKRFAKLFGQSESRKLEFRTINGFATKIVMKLEDLRNKEGKMSGRHTLVEEAKGALNKYAILRRLYRKYNSDYPSDDKIEQLELELTYLANMLIENKDIKPAEYDTENIVNIRKAYSAFKRANTLMDYDDQLTMAYRILSSWGSLREEYQQRYRYIQVDEAQDTSKVQHKLIELITGEKKNLFMVADDDQSIYGFRAAYPEYLLQFKDKYPDGSLYLMEQNYRSTQDIVKVSNQFIASNKNRYKKNLVTKNESLKPIKIKKASNVGKQLDYLVNKLKLHHKDTAILFRNNVSCVPLVDRLHREGIPFAVKDTKASFFNHRMLWDIKNIMKVANDPTDVAAYEKIRKKIDFYVPDSAVFLLTRKSSHPDETIFDRLLGFHGFKRGQRKKLRALDMSFRALRSAKPNKALNIIEHEIGYGKYLSERSSIGNYSKILATFRLIATNTPTTADFFNRLKELRKIVVKSPYSCDDVTISTVHSAKGLEFDRVFMIDLNEGEFPSERNCATTALLEEERRLFYVGMTRAKTRLELIHPSYINGKSITRSRFIDEVADILKGKKPANVIKKAPAKKSAQISFIDSTGMIKKKKPKKLVLKVGMKLNHKRYGPGIITEVTGPKYAWLDFESCGLRHYDVILCVKNNIMEVVDNTQKAGD